MKSKGRYGHFIRWLFSLVDLLTLNGVFFLLQLLPFVNSNDVFFSKPSWLAINTAYIVVIYLFSDIHQQRVVYADKVMLTALKSVCVHVGLYLSLAVLLDADGMSWRILVGFYVLLYIALGTWWILSRKVLKLYRTRGFNFKRVVVIGGGTVGIRLLNEMKSDLGYGYRIVGFFDNNPKMRTVAGYKGTLNDVDSFMRNNEVDEMYCTVPDDENQVVSHMIRIADNCAVDFYYVPQFGRTVTRQFELHTVGEVPVMSVHPSPLKNPINRFIKRSFDLLISSILLILSPLILIPVAIGIKLSSPGPVFFVQKRTGYRGREFNCYKFRTMRVNPLSDTLQASKDDPRKTRFGNFLRHTSIDELPQFLNVLKGEMSIVGPRPHMVAQTQMYSELIEKYMLRHTIKPGITGWAQVRGYRGQTEKLEQMEKRVECDVYYAENWNFMFDMKIIFLTIINAFRGEDNAF